MITYKLKSLDNEVIKEKFYNEKLTLFDKQDKSYIVEKILYSRKHPSKTIYIQTIC